MTDQQPRLVDCRFCVGGSTRQIVSGVAVFVPCPICGGEGKVRADDREPELEEGGGIPMGPLCVACGLNFAFMPGERCPTAIEKLRVEVAGG